MRSRRELGGDVIMALKEAGRCWLVAVSGFWMHFVSFGIVCSCGLFYQVRFSIIVTFHVHVHDIDVHAYTWVGTLNELPVDP